MHTLKMSPFVMAAVVLASGLAFAQGRPKAEVTPLVEADGVHAGSTVRIALQVSLPDGLHVQSDKPRDGPKTALRAVCYNSLRCAVPSP